MVKNINVMVGVSVAVLGTVAFSAFAASVVLTNGGLGQVATNQQSFGIAVCDGGAMALNQSVPVSVVANGVTVQASSASSISAGQCAYSYVNYADFNMAAGQTYAVAVAIDPNRTVITNTNNKASYTVVVPGKSVAAADANPVGGSFLAVIGSAFANFFAALKNLF